MPIIETGALFIKGDKNPRKRRYQIHWPSDDVLAQDPASKVFNTSMTDADANPPAWKLLGSFGDKGSAQKAADSDIGFEINLVEWK